MKNTFTAVEVARIAGQKVTTVRAWRDRGFLELEGEQEANYRSRRYEAVRELREKMKLAAPDAEVWSDPATDAAWDALEREAAADAGPSGFTFRDLLRACAISELVQHGITPGNAKETFLTDELAQALREHLRGPTALPLAVLNPSGKGLREWSAENRYLMAQRWTVSGKFGLDILPALSLKEVHAHLAAVSASADDRVTALVIDTKKLAKRIVAALDGGSSGRTEPKP